MIEMGVNFLEIVHVNILKPFDNTELTLVAK